MTDVTTSTDTLEIGAADLDHDKPATSEEGEKGVQAGAAIVEAYVRLSTVQWEWAKRLPMWQRNALFPLVAPDSLVHPDHPLREPGSDGISLFEVKDKDGCIRVSMSLRQLEYLQYYIHEMRLADPVWTRHLMTTPDDQVEQADKSVGPPEYPPNEEWIPLPDHFIYGEDILSVEPISFSDAKEMKRYLTKQRSANKKIMTKKMMMDEREFEAAKARMLEAQARAKELEEEERRKAQEDNEREGPGLRRGPERERHRPRQNTQGDDQGGEGDDESEDAADKAKTGWGGFPLQDETEAELVKAKTLSDLEGMNLSGIVEDADTPDSSVPATPQSEPEAVSNFATAYYDHAQQALLIATLGGLFEAQKGQPDYVNEAAGLTQGAPIGRSLFISLRHVTWEKDESVVLEVGWSAIWWQEQLDASESDDKYEELRDAGHFKIEDHIATKANGTVKPNHRNDYQLGDSLPIASKGMLRIVEEKMKDLATRAGGGPTYVVLHSTDGAHANPSNLGLATKDWYTQFKPSSWDYPAYGCTDGIGKTFVIDTAILFAAVQHDPKSGPAPIKTDMTLEEVAWLLFGKDDLRRPAFAGNAGNDAFYNLEVFIALVTAESLESLREDLKFAKATPELVVLDPISFSSDTIIGSDDENAQKGMQDDQADDDEDNDDDGPKETEQDDNDEHDDDDEDDFSDDDMIKGVYTYGEDGELVQLG